MINILISKITLNISGKNINRFIRKLRANRINILKIKYKSKNEANITIYKKDYEKIKKIKSIYDIKEIDLQGFIKIKKNIINSKHLIILIILFFSIFLLLTNMIFDIEIIHSNKNLRRLIKRKI